MNLMKMMTGVEQPDNRNLLYFCILLYNQIMVVQSHKEDFTTDCYQLIFYMVFAPCHIIGRLNLIVKCVTE